MNLTVGYNPTIFFKLLDYCFGSEIIYSVTQKPTIFLQ